MAVKQLTKKKIDVEILDENGDVIKKDTIVHRDGEDSLKHNNEVKTGDKSTPPAGMDAKGWFLTNPCYWYRDSSGHWRQFCW